MGWWNKQGTASTRIPQDKQQYFSGTNPGAYGSDNWRSKMNQSYNWPDSGARYEYNRPYNMIDVAGEDPSREWREDNEINYLDQYPRPHQTNMADVSGQVGEYGVRPGEGIMATDQAQKKNIFSRFTTPMMALLQSQKNNPEENFGMDYYGSSLRDGRVNRNPAFNLHGDMNVASGFGEGLGAAGQKRIDRIQKTIANLPKQWSNLATGSEDEQAQYAAKMAAHQEKLRQFKIQNQKYNTAFTGQGGPEEIKEKITETITPKITHHTGGGNQGGSYQDQGGGYSTQGGFTQATQASPDTGRGHHSWADGGRIGYQDGELVEQETDFIEGPQGGEEFQETVVEGQEQPSREQLEALAMEIFQLPLEELDEQQLLVVYQEAMQGQPMEESVQEDEVQFAAQGGLAGLL